MKKLMGKGVKGRLNRTVPREQRWKDTGPASRMSWQKESVPLWAAKEYNRLKPAENTRIVGKRSSASILTNRGKKMCGKE